MTFSEPLEPLIQKAQQLSIQKEKIQEEKKGFRGLPDALNQTQD